MGLALFILFCVGVHHASKSGWLSVRTRGGRAPARVRTTPRSRADILAQRQRRQQGAAWWAGEIRHGFPVTRHGFSQGWAEHRQTWRERQRDAAARDAGHEMQWADWRAEIAAHRHALQVARDRAPTMSGQLKAAVAAERQNEDRANGPPLADGQTPGTGPVNGHKPPVMEGNGMTTPNGRSTGSGGDMNYEQSVETADKLIAAADNSANDEALATATAMGDQLQAMIPDDRDGLGLIADVQAAAIKIRDGAKELMEKSAAFKDHLTKTYGSTQESVDASGVRAPQPEFLDH